MMTLCYQVDAFKGNKKVDSETVTKTKLNKTIAGFEEDGYRVKRRQVPCE